MGEYSLRVIGVIALLVVVLICAAIITAFAGDIFYVV